MGSGKGGGTKVEIPAWAEDAMKANLKKAQGMSEIGYMPYYGPDVAAFTPMQLEGMKGAYGAASAFGLADPSVDPLAGIPEAKDFGDGMMGYSSGSLFDMARAEFEGRSPQQAAAYNAFYKPFGGGQPGAGFPDAYGGDIPPPKELTADVPGVGGAGGLRGGGGGYYGGFPGIPGIGMDPNSPEWQAFIQQFQNTQVV